MENRFFPNPFILIDFSAKNCQTTMESIDLGLAVILVFVGFGKHHFVLSKLAGMLDLLFFECSFVKKWVQSPIHAGNEW